MFDDNAQLHTLEGVAASILLIGVIIYAIDATSMTPLTSSTSNAHVESELAALGQDILNTLDYTEPGYTYSKLKYDIAQWDGKEYLWNGMKYVENANATYTQNNLTNTFTNVLRATLINQSIAHRVELTYLIRSNNVTVVSAPQVMINAGVPSNNAVVVSRKIVYNSGDSIGLVSNNPIKKIDLSTNLLNIVDVKLILWRT